MSKKMLTACAAGLLTLAAFAPALRADGFNFNVNINADDEAHFHFADHKFHHHPEILKAAKKLQTAKHDLWNAKNDFGGHKADAIQAINAALDQLRICEEKR